jgi:hypothetical protein
MTPTAYVWRSLESVLRWGVETVFFALLTLAACALAITAVAALAPRVRRIVAARRQSTRDEVSAILARSGSLHGSRRLRPRAKTTSRFIRSAWPIAVVLVVASNGSRLATNAQTSQGPALDIPSVGPLAGCVVFSARSARLGPLCGSTTGTKLSFVAAQRSKAGAPPVVTIIATDYAYEAPDTVQAGVNVFRLVNHGDQVHAATIVRLEAGKTLADYKEAYGEAHRVRGARPTWATFRGGPVAVMRGEGSATLSLEPGNYAWVCFVPGPDSVSHLLKHNQAHAFVVRPRTGDTPAPSAPDPSVSLRMLDYSFQLTAPLKAGRHTIRVENVGADYHHVLLFKLTPGKTIQDVEDWLHKRMEGEAPSTFVGAMGELSPGTNAYLEVDLTAGEYVLACVITGRDEVSHAVKGMIQQIRVN